MTQLSENLGLQTSSLGDIDVTEVRFVTNYQFKFCNPR